MDFIDFRNISNEEMETGKVWKDVTSSYKKGHVFDQTADQLMNPDMNWCAGATAANVYECMTGKIESGKAIYETTKSLESSEERKETIGSSLPASFNALSKRQGLKNAKLVILDDFEKIMRFLVAKGAVAFGGNWPEGMFYPKGYCKGRWIEYAGNSIGYHAATIIGTSSRGYVKVENSWGQYNWAPKGTAFMKWSELEKFSKTKYFSAYGFEFDE